MKILMRAAMSPLDNPDPFEMISKNRIGDNMGNMMFPHSICRTVMTEGTQIDTIKFTDPVPRGEIDRINQTYDMVILPFANALRKSFLYELKVTTDVIRKLKIPCVVVGIGTQVEFGKELSDPRLLKQSRAFVRAVLDHSAKIGVRGEQTADFLKKIGFAEEKDFTVIGCPSMFMYGKDLPVPHVRGLSPESPISITSKIQLGAGFHDFMYRTCMDIPDHTFIPQVIQEIKLMYWGMPMSKKFAKHFPAQYPSELTHPLHAEGRSICFPNAVRWMEFLAEKDFCVGSRMHGSIAAIMAGTPVHVLVSDPRILELTEYHRIPSTLISEMPKKESVFDLYARTDFNSILDGHEQRFLHYLDFLKENGIGTIYDADGRQGRCPFDEAMAQIDYHPGFCAFSASDPEEQSRRLKEMCRFYETKLKDAQKVSLKRVLKSRVRAVLEKAGLYKPL